MKTIIIAPNRPLVVALADPQGEFDFDTGQGRYLTATGELLTLPRPAVVLLNELDPRPGEEIRITKSWSGKYGEPSQWSIELTSRSEQARAGAESTATLTERLETADETPEPVKAAVEAPTPIRRPAKQPKAEPQVQPRLFDTRGTGTHGPAPASRPLPVLAVDRKPPSSKTRYRLALREIVATVVNVLGESREQWNDAAKQDIVSTLFIQAARDGRIVFDFPEE